MRCRWCQRRLELHTASGRRSQAKSAPGEARDTKPATLEPAYDSATARIGDCKRGGMKLLGTAEALER